MANFLKIFHSRLSIFLEDTLILVQITKWDSTVCAGWGVWGDHGSAFCHSCLCLITAFPPSPVCRKLPPSWRQLDSSHPKSPVSSCTYLFMQQGLAEMQISLKPQSHLFLSHSLSILLNLQPCCHQCSDIYLNRYHIPFFFLLFFSSPHLALHRRGTECIYLLI